MRGGERGENERRRREREKEEEEEEVVGIGDSLQGRVYIQCQSDKMS